MNIEKLKPWNWFKHEDNSASQIPVTKKDASGEVLRKTNETAVNTSQAMGSLLQLHQDMNRLFDDVWRLFGMPSTSSVSRPASLIGGSLFDSPFLGDYRAKLDVSGNKKEYEVSIDLPGLSEDDIQIELNGHTLIIRGQKEETNETNEKQYYRVERTAGSFQRTLSLPDDANRDAITANMKNGVLAIKIPRLELPEDDVKRISISS